MFKSRTELLAFVARLRIPEARRTLVEAELLDHLDSRLAAGLAAGGDEAKAEREALAAFGDPDQLRASLERIEPAFDIDPVRATVRGLASAILASIVFAILGELLPHQGPAIRLQLLAAWSVTALCGLIA